MEKLFARNGISLLAVEDQEGKITYFAYNDALLAQNILIKFFTAIIDDTVEGREEETNVFAITFDEKCFYTYFLSVSHDVTGPLLLYRIVADAIDFIQRGGEKTLLEDLKAISAGHTTSDVFVNPTDRKQHYESEVEAFKAILALIEQGRSSKP